MISNMYQCKISLVAGSAPSSPASICCWSMPAYITGMTSYTVSQLLGIDGPCVGVHRRVAEQMGLDVGDTFALQFVDAPEQSFEVVVNTIIDEPKVADVVINGAINFGIVESESFSGGGVKLGLPDGVMVPSMRQSLFTDYSEPAEKAAQLVVSATESAYSFRIMDDKYELMHGFGYQVSRSREEMAVDGLLEGALWASRCMLKSLLITSDCEAVIQLLDGAVQSRDVYNKAMERLGDIRNVKWNVSPQNASADELVKKALSVKSHAANVNWDNMNNFLGSSGSSGTCALL